MKVEHLQEANHRRPFNPFTIQVADGASYYVPSPDFIMFKPSERAVFILHLEGPGYDVIDMNAIVRIIYAHATLERETAGTES